LKDTGIIMTLENIFYDILIHTGHQRSAATVESYASPERVSHISQDWVIQMTINRFMIWLQYEL
jgi:hypothetical protein